MNEMYHIINVLITQIVPGDTVVHNGELKTVCRNNLKHDRFIGRTLFGDSYLLGTKKVQKVVFCHKDEIENNKPYNNFN